jgi:hypothetical protein
MTVGLRVLMGVVAVAALAPAAAGQEPALGARLQARGAAADLAARVETMVRAAERDGLPGAPIADKAIEGLAKRAPSERILAVLDQLRARLRQGQVLTREAGLDPAPGAVVAAAAEALGRGMDAEDVRGLVRAAPGPDAAAAGLTVAAALAAQGLDHRAAALAVRDAYRRGPGGQQLYELPSAVADLTARGLGIAEVARRIMEGGGLPLPPMMGEGRGRGPPAGVPPAQVPGKGQGQGQGQGSGRRR